MDDIWGPTDVYGIVHLPEDTKVLVFGQVLEGMKEETTGRQAVKSFAESAKMVLRNRVRNSPPARNEARWLPGWLKRVDSYVEG